MLIAEFPGDGMKCIKKICHIVQTWLFLKKKYDIIFQQVTHRVGESEMNYINRLQNAQALTVSVGNN